MTNIWIFSGVAAALVYLAGRRDAARDPRLTTAALALLSAAPLLALTLPKAAVLPAASAGSPHETHFLLDHAGWIWLAGTGVGLVRLGFAALGLAAWRRRSRLLRHEHGIDVRLLPGLSGPVAAGVFRKIIFVPETALEWPAGTWRMVMAHERGHHLRRDPLRRWIAGLAIAVHWFNPLVWWMARRLALQCEYACDARVLGEGGDPQAYAALLCDMAVSPLHGPHAIAMAQKSSLERRVKRLMRPSSPAGPAPLFALMAGLSLSAAVATLTGPESPTPPPYSAREIEARWSANPFPAGR